MVEDQEIKDSVASKRPWKKLLDLNQLEIDEIPNSYEEPNIEFSTKDLQKAFGYTQEDEKFLINPMIINGMEATGSMGTDTPLAIFSQFKQPLYNFFKQIANNVLSMCLSEI